MSLFVSTIRPQKPVTAQTLAHWVKSLLRKTGIDTTKFTAYSEKHAAVSKAVSKEVDIDTIRRTAGWSEQSKVSAKFYNRPMQKNNDTFGRAVLSK